MKHYKMKHAHFFVALGLIFTGLTSCETEYNPEQSQSVQLPQSVQQASNADLLHAKLIEEAAKGGLESIKNGFAVNPKAARPVATNFLNTRVLINGSIIGYGVSGYQQSYVSTSGNFMTPIAELLRRFEYTVSFANGVLTGVRRPENTFGAQRINITVGSTSVSYLTSSGQSTSLFLPEAALNSDGAIFAPARVVALLAGAATAEFDADTTTLQTYYYEVNDFGIYFYGIQQNASNDAVGCQKYIPGEPNPFFTATRKTLIYAHGYQPGSIGGFKREGFLFNQAESGNQNVQNYWKLNSESENWNIGIFQWIQLADDSGLPPITEEKKIYDANSSGIGMRWRKSNNTFSTRGNPSLNVLQLYRQEYQKITAVVSNATELRLIGNSLGGNLTMAMLREVAINGARVPNRVTLMDPYWNPGLVKSSSFNLPTNFVTPNSSPDTRYVGKDAAVRLNNLDVAIEYFVSSAAGSDGYNRGVAYIAQYTNLLPYYTNDIAAKHTQPTRVYMWSKGLGFPSVGPHPNRSNLFVRQNMNTDNYFSQSGQASAYTAGPGDDTYILAFGKP
ncbi:hypothetical protein [Flavobacterium circumlabens]|nr:hypothetical protein [Flavobacterium circumlabens]TCN59587.1 hypothetical protein EV142_102205 [Flavobacterium circumlabens]